jgi:hypothetical protein
MKLPLLTSAALVVTAGSAFAADLRVDIEIPRQQSAEYHSPYVAVWLENPDQSAVATLQVWYDVAKRNNEGQTWLAQMRTWWRKTGRSLTLPADGVSGATRAPGHHTVTFRADNATLRGLPAGQYTVAIEAAREAGGREVVRVPFQWGGGAAETTVQGTSELGAITVAVIG